MIDSQKQVRSRFAPSPTGFLHVGNFRTALFSHLWAKHNLGKSILRIEDTDQDRKVDGAVEHMLKIMTIMGLKFDEGFVLQRDGRLEQQGQYGPYLQSQRLDLYHDHISKLLQAKKAYYCFCSEERLTELRKEQTALKKPPMYDRKCRNLSEQQLKVLHDQFKALNKKPVVRFAIPDGKIKIHDLIYGEILYDNEVLDDQVLLKADGFPTYHLAVVIDDHFMEITHVIRGEEWIPSTPKHLLLYQAFGWSPPQFAHLPLILNPDKSKLSKRQGDVTVEDYLNKGYLPEALLNFVAFLGWNPKTQQEIFSLQDLIKEFDLAKVNKSGAVFDVRKLDWINSYYIRQKSAEELSQLLIPHWQEAGIDTTQFAEQYFSRIAKLEQERLKKLSEIGDRTKYFFEEPQYEPSLLKWKQSSLEDARLKLEELTGVFEKIEESNFTPPALEQIVKDYIAAKNYDNGAVLWPLRVALTGLQASPGPFEVAAVLYVGLGKPAILSRLMRASAAILSH